MVKAVEKESELPVDDAREPIILPDYDARISEIAYFKAKKRNFEPGYELDDWLEAEQEYIHLV